MITPLFIGTTELVLIGGIALLLFGGKKLPEMMRGLGQGVKEFKDGMNEVKKPLDEATQQTNEIEQQDAELTNVEGQKDARNTPVAETPQTDGTAER